MGHRARARGDVPQVSTDLAPVEGDPDGPQWGTKEYAEQRGYGITTWDDGVELGVPEGEDAWTDPNAEYLDSLSETARESYDEALRGPQPTDEELESGQWEYDPANAGCYGRASEEVYDGGETSVWEQEQVEVGDAGYPGLAGPQAAHELIYSELDALFAALAEQQRAAAG